MTPDGASVGPARPFRVGEWLVRPELNRIAADGRTIQIEPRVMEVLVYLALSAGRVATRKELHDAVWGDTVVSDQTLTRAIWELRNALGDDPDAPRIIETIRKGGYRLIAPVTPAEDREPPGPSGGAATRPKEEPGRRPRRIPGTVTGVAVAVLAIASAVTWITLSSRDGPAGPSILEARPLTTLPLRELYPAISPDGTRVAFSWKGEGEGYDLYLKQVNAESRLRLTDGPEDDILPTWSPDGSMVAFVRRSDHYSICTVPSIGGEVRKLGSVGWGAPGIDWSPDGAWIAFAPYDDARMPVGIRLISPETLETRELTAPPPRSERYAWPRFSPDGRTIAFLRSDNLTQWDVWLVSVDGREPRRLTHMLCPMAGMDWTGDGEHLVLSVSQGQDHLLWLVSTDDGSAELLLTQIVPAAYPSVSAITNRLVYESQSVDRGIWRMELGGDGEIPGEPAPFITSTRVDCCPQYSRDGSRIAFLSARSGHKEVWICDSDGGNLRRLTSMENLSMTQPHWSPDGRHIAVSTIPEGWARAVVIDVQVGTVLSLSTAERHEVVDAWSRDGQWIYMHCSSDSGWCEEKVRVDGSETVPLGIQGGPVIFESTAGDLLLLKYGEAGIWKVDARTGDAGYLVDPESAKGWTDVTVADDGVFFVRHEQEAEFLGFFDFATGRTDSLASLAGFANVNLSVSPDRRTVLFERPERNESDVILVPGL